LPACLHFFKHEFKRFVDSAHYCGSFYVAPVDAEVWNLLIYALDKVINLGNKGCDLNAQYFGKNVKYFE
jgi:hypothetical protein